MRIPYLSLFFRWDVWFRSNCDFKTARFCESCVCVSKNQSANDFLWLYTNSSL